MEIRALDISEANSYIKRILINDPILDNLKVKGEISNFKVHSSGNVYLSLKDENSKLNCVIFKSNYNKNLELGNGDIINVIKRRFPKVNIKLYPVNVQGSKSKDDICEGIRFFNKMENVETIIVGRGGGSIEELWSFNEEDVAKEIFKSKIPIISAVGHETDFTICDFVSDLRAPTPSAAAELATPSLDEINYKLLNIKNRISKSLTNQVNIDEYKLMATFDKINSYLDSYIIKDKIIQLDKIYDKITFGIENSLKFRSEKLVSTGTVLHNLSPLATMDRGYSILQKEGNVVKSVKELKKKEKVDIVLKDGNVNCTIDNIKLDEV